MNARQRMQGGRRDAGKESTGIRYEYRDERLAVGEDHRPAGRDFLYQKGLPFTYHVKGGELFASRRERSITRSTFEKALRKIQEAPGEMSGPKKLNVYGAPYVWAILWEVFLREEMQGG